MLKLDYKFKKLADIETPTCRSSLLEDDVLSQGVPDSSLPTNSTQVEGEVDIGFPPAPEVSNIEPSEDPATSVLPATPVLLNHPATLLPPRNPEGSQGAASSTTASVSTEIHRCECGKICLRKEGLKQHKKNCVVDTPVADFSKSIIYQCSLCSTPCTTALSLRQHTGSERCKQRQLTKSKSVSLTLALSESESTQREVHECNKCGGSFKTKKGLASHKSRSAKCKVRANYNVMIEY